jgi:hypothetical protein
MRTRFLPTSFAVALLVAAPSLAHAQQFNQIGNSGKPAEPPPKAAPPPPALPGAASTGNVAPATRIPTDMEPTEALFDAINRGDIGVARDAISRGADLHGQNVLGMTPLELSIDLGRNDISFMLLSMRGGDDGRGHQGQAVAAKPSPTKQARQVAKQVQPRPAARVAASAPAATQTARLYSGDGGAPNPNAGFLGFDSGRR